jgi:hypothetical protein
LHVTPEGYPPLADCEVLFAIRTPSNKKGPVKTTGPDTL